MLEPLLKASLKTLLFLRGLLFFPFVTLLVLFCFLGLFFLMILRPFLSFKGALKFGDFFINFFSKGILCFLNLKVKVEGLDKVPFTEKGCLFLFKHASYLDIPVLAASLPRSFRFGAKIELFKIPIFGFCLKTVNTLPIDRGAREKVLALYEKSTESMEKGLSYALAPEGTRYEEGVLGSFKKGPFFFALSSQASIVPVVLYGVAQAFHPKEKLPCIRAWSHNIKVKILDPINVKEGQQDLNTLRHKVYDVMLKAYKEEFKDEKGL